MEEESAFSVNPKGGRPRRNREREILFLAGLGFNRDQIARMTGLKRSSLRIYLHKIRQNQGENVNKTVNKTPLKCPECGHSDFYVDRENGEVVCKNCGLVVGVEPNFEARLPFDEDGRPVTYALESPLAVGKSLGGTLPRKGYFKVLAKSLKGSEDLGLRARQIRVITETNDHPELAALLKNAYAVSKRFKMEGDKLFNNDLGRNIRRAFWLVKELNLETSRKAIVETVFWLTLCQYGKDNMALQVKNTLKSIDATLLSLTVKLNHFLLSIKKEKPPPLESFIVASKLTK